MNTLPVMRNVFNISSTFLPCLVWLRSHWMEDETKLSRGQLSAVLRTKATVRSSPSVPAESFAKSQIIAPSKAGRGIGVGFK